MRVGWNFLEERTKAALVSKQNYLCCVAAVVDQYDFDAKNCGLNWTTPSTIETNHRTSETNQEKLVARKTNAGDFEFKGSGR